MNLDSSKKCRPITFKDAMPIVSLYWLDRIAKNNGVTIPQSVAQIMDDAPGYRDYRDSRDAARSQRNVKIRTNPKNSHA